MAIERFWFAASQLFTANGTNTGLIEVADVANFYVKAKVRISSTSAPAQLLEIKRIEGKTRIFVGPIGSSIQDRTDVSAYLVAHNARIDLYEQEIPRIPPEDMMAAVYAREPIVAIRSALVDKYGEYWSSTNPLPVQLQSGSIQIGQVNAELEVQLSHQDNVPNLGDVHDSVRLGDGVQTMTGSSISAGRYALDVLPANSLIKKRFDGIFVTARNGDGDPTTIEFRLGASVVNTVNITYNVDGDVDTVIVS